MECTGLHDSCVRLAVVVVSNIHKKLSLLEYFVALIRAVLCVSETTNLTAESVQSPSLSLECIDYIHSGDGLPLCMFGVCDGIADDVLEEHFQNAACLLVDQSRDSLHTTSASQTANCWFGDTLDIVTKNFPVTLGASFS